MKSIIQSEKECFVCGTTVNLECHHIFNGPLRKKADKDGCWCWLCAYHHRLGKEAVHQNAKRMCMLKRYAQLKYEEMHSHDEYMKRYHKNYL